MDGLRSNRMFCIVKFTGGRKSTVVPDSWLSINDALCLLPPKATDSDIEVLVRNLAEPGEGWQMLEVSSLETFDTYSEAKKKLDKSRGTPQSEASSQRKRKKPRYLEDYTTNDSDEGRKPYTVFGVDLLDEEAQSENEWTPESIPRIEKVMTVETTQNTRNEENIVDKIKRSISSVLPHLPEEKVNDVSKRLADEIGVREVSDLSLVSNEDLEDLKPIERRKLLKAWEFPDGIMEKVLREIESVKKDIRDLKQQKLPDVEQEEFVLFPVKSIEDIVRLNKTLNNNEEFSKQVHFLGRIGGRDFIEVTRRILGTIMTNNVALQLNWIGGYGKQSLKDLTQVVLLIFSAVLQVPTAKDATRAAVEDVVKRWLRTAIDRDGGRTNRKLKLISQVKASDVNLDDQLINDL